jgi:hypothetical protein
MDAVKRVLSLGIDRMISPLADAQAFSAADASRRVEQDFRVARDRFGIVTPEAMQITSFKEHCRTDPRTIVQRHALYIADTRHKTPFTHDHFTFMYCGGDAV